MKIIGQVSNTTALVEATVDELAKIIGVKDSWTLPRENRYQDWRTVEHLFPVGREIKVSELWKIIEEERQRPEAIASTARNLRALADKLDGVNADLQPVVTFLKEPA